jgi:hypothetical protein
MRANNPRVLIPVVPGIVIIVLALSIFTGEKPYSTDLADLEKQFNNDKGKARLMMLEGSV